MEQARLQQQREAEAEARAAARRAEREREPQQTQARPEVWRRPGAAAPATPTRAPAALPLARSESPAPVADAAPKFKPGANAPSGGWRARAAAKTTAPALADVPSRTASPAPRSPAAEPPADSDGFQQVSARGTGAWRRGRGRG